MGVLNPQLRCNHCGSRLPGQDVAECPDCHSALVRVGVWSELLEWGKIRQTGRSRYVWRRGVLGWVGLLALGGSLGRFLTGSTPWIVYTWIVFANLIGGFCLGQWYWRTAEREYQAWVRQGRQSTLKSRPDEPAMLDHPLRDRLLDG
jgi:hypothetical protein